MDSSQSLAPTSQIGSEVTIMSIPDYQTIMRPLLEALKHGAEHRLRDIQVRLADHFGLTSEDRDQMLPSGFSTVFNDRVGWARYYLQRAGMLRQTRRSVYQLTEAGRKLLSEVSGPISNQHLRSRSDEFRSWVDGPASGTEEAQTEQVQDVLSEQVGTPEETLVAAYQSLRRVVETDLLARLRTSSPAFFEHFVVRLLVAMGYGGSLQEAGRAIGRSGDEGIDGIINEDKLGLDVVYVQAKRWAANVGRPEIQQFAGALAGKRARKGVFITTSAFTSEARAYASSIDSRIVLMSGEELARFMFEHNVGVAPAASYPVKRVDADFFDEE
jgi:restriction system protein